MCRWTRRLSGPGTAHEAQPGGYYGPDGLAETRGRPGPSRIPAPALDPAACARLWEVSQDLSGVRFG